MKRPIVPHIDSVIKNNEQLIQETTQIPNILFQVKITRYHYTLYDYIYQILHDEKEVNKWFLEPVEGNQEDKSQRMLYVAMEMICILIVSLKLVKCFGVFV